MNPTTTPRPPGRTDALQSLVPGRPAMASDQPGAADETAMHAPCL